MRLVVVQVLIVQQMHFIHQELYAVWQLETVMQKKRVLAQVLHVPRTHSILQDIPVELVQVTVM